MQHTKRYFALAMLAFGLVSAMGAGPASASWLVSETGPTSLKATPTGSHVFAGPSHFFEFGCKGPVFTGTIVGASTAIASSSMSDYTECVLGSSRGSLKTNGCLLTFHPGEQVGAAEFNGAFDIAPSTCGPMTWNLGAGCEVVIYPKSGLSAEFKNEGEGSAAVVKLTARATGLKYKGQCGGTGEDGTYTGSWTLQGFNSGGVQVGIHIATHAPNGIYVSGEGSAEEAKRPRVNAEAYPAILGGNLTEAMQFKVGGSTAECTVGQPSGQLTETASSVEILSSFSGCKAYGFAKATVEVGSACAFRVDLQNVGPSYSASSELQCPKEGAGMTISPLFMGYPVCTVTIPAQSLGTVAVGNSGSGSARHVTLGGTATGIEHSEGCGLKSGKDGTLRLGFDLSGVK